MNLYETVNTEYLSSSRTLETILISNSNAQKIFYVYNYEGYSYRLFNSVISLLLFFEEKIESKDHFDKEKDLDNFLYSIELK